jgi:ABC-type bacteriocin/lantibiotic exporter with double-glycine peptidase domain
MGLLKNEIILPFLIEEQEKSRWCWAAVAVSIAKFYNHDIQVSQLQLATTFLGSENNNHVQPPQKAIEWVKHYKSMQERPLTLEEIYLSLMEGNPIAACMRYFIGWHLVIIYGISTDGQLYIADPQHGYTTTEYKDFIPSYLDNYSWTQTILLERTKNT